MRSHYWTCSKFADWIRGTTKLKAGTSEEWQEWEKRAKADYPVRWWLAEEGLDYIQKFVYYIPDQLDEVRYYINNRWISRSHSLTAHARDIKPGNWCDVGNRFLPCLFNELVDFVEVEQAWHHCCWSDEAKTKFAVPWWRKGWFRWRTWRCPEAGLEYLRWASNLTNEEFLEEGEKHLAEPTYQAKTAKEIIELYTWWTETYRNRPDPYDASGWTAYCEASRAANGGSLWGSLNADKSPELRKMSDESHTALRKIEEAYAKEEEQMMIRLIKIRESLWT
jgi:hypothetical protein